MKTKFFFLVLVFIGFIHFMNAQLPSYVPTNGLVGYWGFTGNANDVSGNGNNGTVTGATLTTDRFGNANSAYSFNGSTNYIAVPHNAAFNMQQATWNVWVKISAASTGLGTYIFGKRDNAQHHVTFNEYQGNGNGSIGWAANQASGGAGNSIVAGWHLLTLTYDQSLSTNNFSYYFDGVYKAVTTIQSFTFNNGDIRFGIEVNNSYWQAFKGLIDDASIYNRILTQTEISMLYNSDSSCQSLVINTGILSFNPITYNNTITIYPNPAKDHITIDCGTLTNVVGYSIKITNTLGQEVFNQPMNTQQYYIPLNSWGGQGMYFVNVINAQGNTIDVRKIILQ